MTRQPERRPVEVTTAWHVAPGDVLVGGVRVLNVQREPRDRMVTISTDRQPAGVEVAGDHPVRIERRAH
jgi:hypothetical protein